MDTELRVEKEKTRRNCGLVIAEILRLRDPARQMLARRKDRVAAFRMTVFGVVNEIERSRLIRAEIKAHSQEWLCHLRKPRSGCCIAFPENLRKRTDPQTESATT